MSAHITTKGGEAREWVGRVGRGSGKGSVKGWKGVGRGLRKVGK